MQKVTDVGHSSRGHGPGEIRLALSSYDLSAQFHGSFGENGKIARLSTAVPSVGNRPRLLFATFPSRDCENPFNLES